MRSKTTARDEVQSALAGLYERGEEVVTVLLEEVLGNPRLRDQLTKTLGRAAEARRRVDKNMETLLSLLSVPSRGDYHRLLERIDALHGNLINLNMKLDRLLAAQQSSRPSRPAAAKQRKSSSHRK